MSEKTTLTSVPKLYRYRIKIFPMVQISPKISISILEMVPFRDDYGQTHRLQAKINDISKKNNRDLFSCHFFYSYFSYHLVIIIVAISFIFESSNLPV